ncbi:WD40 repeat domain-containing protein [Deinococcus fonticola]|uniref:WD40 repeat domain-containing protein n=1 Tax=Deinococcus fonticola TaxID=2528713 RepID=UPI001074E062|nr:PQQ-binding-like beta-propeller repeat protein [Deinococcus fonticola]
MRRMLLFLTVAQGFALAADVTPLWEAAQVTLPYSVQSVALSPDGKTLVVGTFRDVGLYDPVTLKRLRELPGGDGGGWGATFSQAGKLAVAGVSEGAFVWNDLSKAPQKFTSPGGRVFGLAWSPDGQKLALGDAGGHWRVEPGGPSGQLKGDVMAAVWSLDGQTLFLSTGQEDSAVYALNARTGQQLWRQQNVPKTHVRRPGYGLDEVNGLTLSPDGKRLACAHQDGRVLLRDPASGRLLKVLEGGQDTRWTAFTPDSSQLVAVGEDGGIHVWDVKAGKQLAQAQVNQELWWVTVTPDGQFSLTAGEDTHVRQWRLP